MIKYLELSILLTQRDQAPNPYGSDPPPLFDLKCTNYQHELKFLIPYLILNM